MKVVAALLFLLIVVAAPASAEVRFDNTIVMVNSSGIGYLNPGLLYRTGVDVESKRLLVRAEGRIGSARKRETGDGWVRKFRTDAYVNMGRLLVGGGAAGSKQTTSRWSKGSIHPLVGGGYQNPRFRLLAAYFLPGTDRLNGSTGVDVQIRAQISRRVAFSPEVTLTSFYSTGRPELGRKFGISTGVGVTYSFTKGVAGSK